MNFGVTVVTGWHKSSYSTGTGNCVEVGWRKSSYSTATGNCVEVAPVPGVVMVRDSKSPAAGTVAVPRGAWSDFLRLARS
ncbi:MAG: DUF397 domain-containing protein [Nocardioidaceae bacterium]